MNLIFLSLLCIGITCVKGQCEEHEHTYPEGCYDDLNIAKIQCKGTLGNWDNCECADPTNDLCTALLTDLGTAEDMNATKCLEICESESSCVFFRWEETYGIEHCSLMDVDQCKSYEPCSGDHCTSGQKGCQSGEGPIGKKCTAAATFTRDFIHWNCINPYGDTQTHIDIYQDVGPPDIIPQGTICYTERKCAAFDAPVNTEYPEDLDTNPDYLYHTFVVQCKGDTDIAKWEKFPESTNNPENYIGGGFHLEDPPCSFDPTDPLKLDTKLLTESGVSFICSDGTKLVWGDTEVTVEAPNTCALLCNFHHAMTIEPKFQENTGESKWWKYSTVDGEQMDEEATKDNVFCWKEF